MMDFIKITNSVILLTIINVLILVLGFNSFNLYGIPLMLIGGFIYFYHRHLMAGVWSVKIESKKRMITKGLFGYLRHPLYLGVLIFVIGLIISTTNLLLLLSSTFLIVPFTYTRAKIEERLLAKTLKGYKQYIKSTGMFSPKIKIRFI